MVDPNALVGTVIDGRYQLASVVGTGAFGTVFAADEMAFGRVVGQVAVKLVRPLDDHARDAIAREVQAMAQLSHTHLLIYRAAGEVREGLAKGCLFIATELASGTLADRLARPERMTIDETLEVARHLASSLAYLHDRGAIHRDVKPANLLRVGDLWKLGDFGLVRGFAGTSVQSTGRKGTVLYMAPETFKGECGPFTDVWALGVVLQECLSGRYPYSGSCDVEVIAAALSGEPAIVQGLPHPFDVLVGRCLARDRSQRASAHGALEMLDRRPTQAVPPRAPRTAALAQVSVPRPSGGGQPTGASGASVARRIVLRGHTDSVRSVAFSPDGRLALTGSGDQTARLWHVATGREIRAFAGHTGWLNSVAFSPDSRLALTGSGDRTARLWDVATGREIRAFAGHKGWLNSVAFSPDGRLALTSGRHRTARLWDVATGREIRAFVGHSEVRSAAFSPDGRLALTGSGDKTARLWDVATGREIRALAGHTEAVTSVAFAPDGQMALTGSWDATARLWDVATGREIRAFAGHTEAVTSVAFAPDGQMALTGSWDDTARLWDVATGREIRASVDPGSGVTSVAFSRDGRLALTGCHDRTARIWSIDL